MRRAVRSDVRSDVRRSRRELLQWFELLQSIGLRPVGLRPVGLSPLELRAVVLPPDVVLPEPLPEELLRSGTELLRSGSELLRSGAVRSDLRRSDLRCSLQLVDHVPDGLWSLPRP